MKPLKLTMHHFGPFTEETVDFTALDKELFLITGPTGSGKTTIFDGLCYALYGEGSNTDRQSKEMKSQFGDPLSMMWVDFTFALRDRTYRIKRIPEQERKKERGEGSAKQKHEAELYECTPDGEKLLSSSVAGVGEKILEILGLTANQFRQIVMLPQGEFSKLLKAKEEERVELLKSIFRMALYNTLKEKVATKLREIRKTHDGLEVEVMTEQSHIKTGDSSELAKVLAEDSHTIDYVLDLTHQEITADKAEVEVLKNAEQEIAKALDKIRQALTVGEQLNNRFKLLEEAQEKHKALEAKKEKMAEKESRLKLLKKIQIIKPHLENQQRQQYKVGQAKIALAEAQKNQEKTQSALEKINAAYEKVMAPAYEEKIEILGQKLETEKRLVDSLMSFTQKKTVLEAATQDLSALAEKNLRKDQEEKAIKKLEQEKEILVREVLELEKAIQSTGFTIQSLEAQQEKAKEALEIHKNIKAKEAEIENLRLEWKNLQKQIKEKEGAYEKRQSQQRNQTAVLLGNTLRVGEACPVCGSTEHPQKAVVKTGEVISEEALQEELKSLQDLKTSQTTGIERGRSLAESIEESQKSLKQKIDGLDIKAQKDQTTAQRLKAFIKQLEETVEIQSTHKKNADKQRETKEKEITRLGKTEDNLKKQLAGYEEMDAALKDLQETESMLKGQQQQRQEEIQGLLVLLGSVEGLDNPEVLLKKINSLQKNTDQLIKEKKGYKDTIRLDYQRRMQEETQAQAELKSQQNNIKTAEEEADGLAQIYEESLKNVGLTQVQAEGFQLQTGESQEQMEDEQEKYRFEVKSTEQQRNTLAQELLNKSPVDLEVHRKQMQESTRQSQTTRQRATLLEEKIGQNQKQIKKIETLIETLKKVERLQGIYTHLDQTLKGTLAQRPKISFERYILSAYLQDILESANTFLEKMSSGRYRLEVMGDFNQSGNRGLEIEVVDAYTGLRRSANTLSGGETFMAALSMALGLSDIVQSYAGGISLDTIFIDEGFATLDPEALDNAISCLSAIKNDGRTVGIISHVEELKERIDTKITVRKTESGSHIDICY